MRLAYLVIAIVCLFFAIFFASMEELGTIRTLLFACFFCVFLYSGYEFARAGHSEEDLESPKQDYAQFLRELAPRRRKRRIW